MTLLVTGGTKGIGFAIARYVAQKDDPVVLAYHSDDAAAAAAKAQLTENGIAAVTVRADTGTIAGCAQLIEETAHVHRGTLHIVHGAAMIYPTTLLGGDLEGITHAVQTNGLSLVYLTQKALPLLSRGSSIIFVSGGGARRVISPTYGALGPAKALAEAFILYLVPELAPRGIRINAIAPGLVHTTSVAKMVGGEDAAAKLVERAARGNPTGRESQDSDYASLVKYLLSPEAEFIQGQVIAVTGGA
ncbi:MAG TPA: SDR family oxidoreductase [Rhizomicrobium sp.]|jgi:NAD(P)-dependent dehydrogenase (short-subunit alcohol dehydrogenase family)|nr:SDR family oxidoreductase [Rhizomicrobium sp.]